MFNNTDNLYCEKVRKDDNIRNTFLQLIRQGTGYTETAEISDDVDWKKVKALAEKQGLSAIVLDGIEQLSESQRPPK